MALFDFSKIPFSRHQRFVTLSLTPENYGDFQRDFCLRSVKGGDEKPNLGLLAKIKLFDWQGLPLQHSYDFNPDQLTVHGVASDGQKIGHVSFVIGQGETVFFQAVNCQLHFFLEESRYSYVYSTVEQLFCAVVSEENAKIIPFLSKGRVKVEQTWQEDRCRNIELKIIPLPNRFDHSTKQNYLAEGYLEVFTTVSQHHPKNKIFNKSYQFHTVHQEVQAEFNEWLQKTCTEITNLTEAHRLAAYLLWANCVPPCHFLTRPAIYMSKNQMINLWSWDNAFSAIGLAKGQPELAYQQFMAIFDYQDSSGLLPDFINDAMVSYSFTKTPIHGWALTLILSENPELINQEQQKTMITCLQKQMYYWLNHARADNERLPVYTHGNESGWDNASFFHEGGPVESPDLTTFLILTLECLERFYIQEQQKHLAQQCQQEANDLYELLLKRLWNGQTFIVKYFADDTVELPSTSLIQFMPLLLGKRLNPKIVQSLLACLDELEMITEWGVATESIKSPFYRADGYWRGPIWAPTTLLLLDGLHQQQEHRRAKKLANKFCRLVETSGMAENFDAITGQPLRDPAFAWTAAVYLYLNQSNFSKISLFQTNQKF